MKKKLLAILLIFAFIFTTTAGVYAKGFRSSGGSRSFSRSSGSSVKSFSRSSGFSGSSKSRSSGSQSGSSSRSIPSTKSYGSDSQTGSGGSGSTSGSSSNGWSSSNKSSAKGFSYKTSSKKYSYMQDSYKKQVSSKNFNTYKQKLNTDQQKVYNDSLKRDYGTSSRRMNFEEAMNTRSSRINTFATKRPIFININTGMFASPFSYGYAYVGPWDLWFLTRASELFWFHHWNEISPYRDYFDRQQFNSLERRVQQLEQQGVTRDTNYLDTDVDPDLQLSQQYQEQNIDKVYYTEKHPTDSNATGAVIIIIVTAVVLIVVIRKVSKPKKNNSNYSRIY